MLLTIGIANAGVVEYGGDLPINIFLNLEADDIRDGMDLTFNGTSWEEEQLNFYYEYWTVDGNYDEGFYIVRNREYASLNNDLIYWCLDTYSVAQCQQGLLLLNESFTIDGRTIDPIVYQINTHLNDEISYLLWLQDYIENEGDIEDFVEGFEL